ncbi:MAG TPA: hypothetical protein VFZ34_17315 [Blastocatellia bacterium]|nr:hypothetical protein [Blastocatellia bacterium]
MNKRIPVILTVILLLVALLVFTQRERWKERLLSTRAAATPEDVIWQMADAARDGDAQAYLDCFSGALRQNLEKTAAEMGEAKFKAYLKQLNDEVTGIAVSDLEQPDPQTATLRVEFVKRGKSETQKHHFKLQAGQWKIEQADNSESKSLLIPYGLGVKD